MGLPEDVNVIAWGLSLVSVIHTHTHTQRERHTHSLLFPLLRWNIKSLGHETQPLRLVFSSLLCVLYIAHDAACVCVCHLSHRSVLP